VALPTAPTPAAMAAALNDVHQGAVDAVLATIVPMEPHKKK